MAIFKISELVEASGGCLLQGKNSGIVKGVSTDSRLIKNGDAFIAIKGDNFDGHDFIEQAVRRGARVVIVQRQERAKGEGRRAKGEKIPVILVKDTIKALGDIARYHRNKFDIPVIAVTGSNGKTTTKEIAAGVLSARFRVLKNEGTKNNHIGLPLTLLGLKQSHDMAVLELGANHPGEIEYLAKICCPDIGVITNIGPAHLEFFCNLKGVFKEKYSLIKNLKHPSVAILNADDPFFQTRIGIPMRVWNRQPFILSFGIESKADFYASGIKNLYGRLEFMVNTENKFTLKTAGLHNIYNAIIGIALGRIFGLSYKEIKKQVQSFNFPHSRLELLAVNNAIFIDDTYNSNPASLKEALSALANFKARGRKIFVMGDMMELGSSKEALHRQIGKDIPHICDIFICVGNLSKLAAEAAQSAGFNIKNIFICDSCAEARGVLFDRLSINKNDIVLVKGSRAMKMEEVFKK